MRPRPRPSNATAGAPPTPALRGAIFDLDGVLADTAELHYRSWTLIAGELGLPFDRRVNDRMRGLSRPESLAILLGDQADRFTDQRKLELTERKNEAYLRLLAEMTPADLYPGVLDLVRGLRQSGVRVAVASSSRNAQRVVERLGLAPLLDALVDANTAPRSKPDPQVFLAAADALGIPPARCVAIEDGEAGVEAALSAGMRVVGIGPPQRVGRAHLVVERIGDLDVPAVLTLFDVR